MVNILFTASNSLRSYGGGEKWAIKVMNSLVERGHVVTAKYLSYLPGGIERLPEKDLTPKLKFTYYEYPFKRGKFSPLHMAQKMEYSGYDVIYTYTTFYLFLKQLLSWSENSGAKRVFGLHNPVISRGTNLNFLERKTVKLIPRFETIHLLDESQISLFSDYKEKIRVLSNSYIGELPIIKNLNKVGPFTILFIGRHETEKGFDMLKEVASKIPDRMNLVILGSGSRSGELKEIERPNVIIEGFVSEERMNELMRNSQVLFFPSVSEASSAVPMEALAFGLPVIYRNIPSNRILKSATGCKIAETPEKVLESMLELERVFAESPDNYLEMKIRLQTLSKMNGDYVENFLSKVLLA